MGKFKGFIWAAGIMLLLSSAQLIWAQEEAEKDQQSFVLEEVMVTAERREASAQKSSISISVINNETLNRVAATSAKDILDSIPGLDMTQASAYGNLSLRSLGAGGGVQYTDPVMAFNIGGVPQSRSYATSAALYDVARVEVLKGPQGTLYGRNATVGAINVIPNRPKDKLEGNTSVTIGNYSTLNTRGMINVPLSENLDSRVAFSSNHHDGYLTSGYNDQNDTAGRASLLYEPDGKLSLLVWADYFHIDQNGPSVIYRYVTPDQEWQDPGNHWFAWGSAGSCDDPAFCPSWGDSGTQFHPGGNLAPDDYENDPILESGSVVGDDAYLKVKQKIYAAELNYRFSDMILTVIPAYMKTDFNFKTYQAALDFTNDTQIDQMTFEARLASDYDGDFKWLAGVFYFDESVDAYLTNLEVGGYQILNTPNLDAKSYAFFGETTIPVTDYLRLIGGLRYTKDEKSQDGFTLLDAFTGFDFNPDDWIGNPYITVVPGPATAYNNWYPFGYALITNTGEVKDDDLSWKIGLETDLSDTSLLYANVRTAYKAGGLDPGLPPNTYEPEKLTAYEVGSKNRFLSNRLQANLELFYWDYKDQQISVMQSLNPAGQSGIPVNVPGYLYGAELNLEALITPFDLIKFNVVELQGKYDIFPTVVSTGGEMGGLMDYDRVNMPKWNGTLNYQHTFDLADKGVLLANASVHYESKTNMRPVAVNVPADLRDAFTRFDVFLNYQAPEGNWEIGAYCKNLSNETILGTGTSGTVGNGIFYRSPENVADMRYAAIEPPRTFGVTVGMKF